MFCLKVHNGSIAIRVQRKVKIDFSGEEDFFFFFFFFVFFFVKGLDTIG